MFQACCFGCQISIRSASDELDYRCLVDGRRGMFHPCGDISAGMVQAARRVGAFAIFVQRCSGRGHRRVRVGLDARRNDCTIRRTHDAGAHLPVWMLIVLNERLVRLYLRAGRLWLAWSICGLRTLTLVFNFVFTPNINYREITSLRHLSWWGGNGLGTDRRAEHVDLGRRTRFAVAHHLFRGCRRS